MNVKRVAFALMVLGSVFHGSLALGDDSEMEVTLQKLQMEQAAMRSEIAALRAELAQLQSILTAQAAQPPATATPTALTDKSPREVSEDTLMLRKIDRKLDRILAQLADLKSDKKKAPDKKADTTVYDVKIGESPVLGKTNAPITIIEFVDFQCPYCTREWPKIQQIMKEYPDQVRVVFKHYPLSFHKKAKPVHAATVLALQQLGNDGFWKMHDLIMANPKKLDLSDLRKHAEALGMDLVAFDRVMGDEKQINALATIDRVEAKRANVRGTPTVLINGMKLANRKIDGYKERIGEILGKKPTPKRRSARDMAGQAAPTFSLKMMNDTTFSNADFANHPATVLNFVAPNCGFCGRQIPKVETVRKDYESRGVRFINVNETMRKPFTPEEAFSKYDGMGSHIEVAIDGNNQVGRLFGASGYPTMFVVTSDGKIAHVNVGAKATIDQMLRTQLDEILNAKKPAQ